MLFFKNSQKKTRLNLCFPIDVLAPVSDIDLPLLFERLHAVVRKLLLRFPLLTQPSEGVARMHDYSPATRGGGEEELQTAELVCNSRKAY